MWEFMRPILSAALVELNRDTFISDERNETTVDLHAHRRDLGPRRARPRRRADHRSRIAPSPSPAAPPSSCQSIKPRREGGPPIRRDRPPFVRSVDPARSVGTRLPECECSGVAAGRVSREVVRAQAHRKRRGTNRLETASWSSHDREIHRDFRGGLLGRGTRSASRSVDRSSSAHTRGNENGDRQR